MTLDDFMTGEKFKVSVRGDKGRMRTETQFASPPSTWFVFGIIVGAVMGGTIVGMIGRLL